MNNCSALIKAIDAYIAKADDNLAEALGKAGFIKCDDTVWRISSLEQKVAETLTAQADYVTSEINRANSLVNLYYGELWSEIKSGDTTADELSEIFRDELAWYIPPLTNDYISTIDPELKAGTMTSGTKSWINTWSVTLGLIMALNYHKDIESRMISSIVSGQSTKEFVGQMKDKPIRDDYYSARLTSVTPISALPKLLLRAHSVAQQEALMQNPAVEYKEWVHTGYFLHEPRENHIAMDGVTARKDEPFNLIGADGAAHYPMYPRDDVLPPGESINCHCTHRGIINYDILGLPLEERERLQGEAITTDNNRWENENRINPQKTLTNPENRGIIDTGGDNVANIVDERRKILDGTYPSRVIQGRQNKHIPGTTEFEQNQEKMQKIGSKPAILEADAQTLVDKYKGTGTIYFSKSSPDYPREDIDTGKIIGKTWDRKESEYIDTSIVTISYSKTGVHIYPNNMIKG